MLEMRLAVPTAHCVDLLTDLLIENQSQSTAFEGLEPVMSEESWKVTVEDYLLHHLVFIFEVDGQFAGAVFCEKRSRILYEPHLHIYKDFRGKGLARKFMAMVGAQMNTMGNRLWMAIPSINHRLIAAVEAAGYIKLGVLPESWVHGASVVDRIVYWR